MLEATVIIVVGLLGSSVLLVVLADLVLHRIAHGDAPPRNADAERYMAEHPSADAGLDVTGQTSGGSSDAGPTS